MAYLGAVGAIFAISTTNGMQVTKSDCQFINSYRLCELRVLRGELTMGHIQLKLSG
jgi:hypothetical protein